MHFLILERAAHLQRHHLSGACLLVQDLVNVSGEQPLELLGGKTANSLMIRHHGAISRWNSIRASWHRRQAGSETFRSRLGDLLG